MSSNLTESQKQFLSNVTQPRPTPTDELRADLATRYPRYQNTRNIIDGANITDYHEYLQETIL